MNKWFKQLLAIIMGVFLGFFTARAVKANVLQSQDNDIYQCFDTEQGPCAVEHIIDVNGIDWTVHYCSGADPLSRCAVQC